ncbi:MAG: ubiquitin-conjugating enzyme E2, partial [Pirellulaceae bacterium]|nr:ubiquitin-conjugating enzyme E2 [Pirellulaceae bacterium]
RRLRNDFRALERLKSESTIVDFAAPGALYGGVPESYIVRFYGRGVWRPEASQEILIRERHEVAITLGASYPRMMPELQWKTPIFHPNISASGVVCLGGYGTHWVPSLNLDELCSMLWDMIRYGNFDVESPYNREAAQWTRTQTEFVFPLDARPIRDRVTGEAPSTRLPPITSQPQHGRAEAEVVFLEPTPTPVESAEIVDAELVNPEASANAQPRIEPRGSGPAPTSDSAATAPDGGDIMFID